MNIRITRLLMTNFKCFRKKELDLDKDIITIRGRNGVGKTTIADAILFCFFGKNTEGQSDLELFKSRENGEVLHNLDYSVELTLTTSAPDDAMSEIILKRSIKEVWVKKRGSEESVFKNNTVDYYVNGESYTKGDYEQYIASLLDERVFRAITNPNYFTSLKWQDQRTFLTAMVGDILPEEVANTEETRKLAELLDSQNTDIISYNKHLKTQIKGIKDKLEKIPVRLEEQNKALPEKLDWDSKEVELEREKKLLSDTERDINKLLSGNGEELKQKEKQDEIQRTRKLIDHRRNAAYRLQRIRQSSLNRRISSARKEFFKTSQTIEDYKQKIKSFDALTNRCKETINSCEERMKELRSQWPTGTFKIDNNLSVCPTCGQPLPEEQWAEKKKQLLNDWNLSVEKKKKSINEKGAEQKRIKEDAEKEIETYKNQKKEDEEQLEQLREKLNNIHSDIAKLEKETVSSAEEILSADKKYLKYNSDIKNCEDFIENLGKNTSENDDSMIADLKSKRDIIYNNISALQQELASRQQYDKITSLINGINEEQKELIKQLSELERKEDIARQYQFRQNQLLEERINKHFKLVQWRLFRTVNNGGDSFEEPFCECYVNGIPYHAGLNQADKLNAGLDICEALSNFYEVSAPIVIDNAESNLNIYQTTGQQIRLEVFDSENLEVI